MRRFYIVLSIGFGSAALITSMLTISTWKENNPTLSEYTAETLPTGKSARFYASMHDRAARTGDWALARAAAKSETALFPDHPSAWSRLAFAETKITGQPSRDALHALLTSYQMGAFPAPAEMKWRVEFAERYWAAMPDVVQTKTLTQIAALGGIGETWPTREYWCKSFVAPALKAAACKTLTDQTAPLNNIFD